MIIKTINKNSIFYHGSTTNFKPENIITPVWLSKYKNQAINHVSYKYKNTSKGYLYTYKNIKNLKLIDISKDGDSRLIINSKGNYYLANKIKNDCNDDIDGYINLQEQGEIMLINNSNIVNVKKETFDVIKNIKYSKTNNNNWRMINKKNSCCIVS